MFYFDVVYESIMRINIFINNCFINVDVFLYTNYKVALSIVSTCSETSQSIYASL